MMRGALPPWIIVRALMMMMVVVMVMVRWLGSWVATWQKWVAMQNGYLPGCLAEWIMRAFTWDIRCEIVILKWSFFR